MKNTNRAYSSLSNQIDRFLGKYYRLLAFKGALMVGVLSFIVLSTVIFLEEVFHFSSVGRSLLFFGSLFLLLLALILQFMVPLLKSFNVLKRMDFKEAAKIISSHVPLLNDQLINAIELESYFKNGRVDNLLLKASVSQKANNILKFDLLSPLSIKQYKNYILSFCLLFFIALLGSVSFSSLLVEPLQRVVNFKTNFEPENPYRFLINDGNDLMVLEGETLDLKIKTLGKTDPERIIIYVGESRFFPTKKNKHSFNYSFKNVQENFSFSLKEGNGDTAYCQVWVLPKAKILEEIKVAVYPKYTQLENDTFKDFSQVILPFGTTLFWNVKLKNASSLNVFFKDTSCFFPSVGDSCYFSLTPLVSQNYKIEVKNPSSVRTDSLNYNIEVKKDQYPTIEVQEFKDSGDINYKYFFGEIRDDFGFSQFYFVYLSSLDTNEKRVPIKYQTQSASVFSFNFDFSVLDPAPGEKISYYFSVYDNDFLGEKETRSAEKFLLIANDKERKKEEEKSRLAKEKALNNLQKQVTSFHDDLKEIKSSLINKKKMDWDDKKNIQNFLTKQKSISINLEEIQKKMNAFKPLESEKLNAEIKEKQDLLNKMIDQLMSDEMKKLYDELNDLVDKMNKDKVLEKVEDIDLSQENLIKELDRTIEHFKKLEIEKKADEIAKELFNLAKQQDSLKKITGNKSNSSFKKNKKQEKIKNDFYSIKNDLYDLKNKNKELANPKDFQTETEEKNIIDALEKAQEKLADKKNNKAKEEQQKASNEMKSLANKMKSLSKSDQAQQEEDMASLRLLLEQLLTFSIQQENLMSNLKTTNTQDPKYVQIGKEQRKLKDEIKVIDDSLSALSKRQIMISNKINFEVQQIKRSLKSSIKNLTERKTRNARANQQTVMMHTNELGLLLSEIMEQMQNKMPGSGQCNKPGGKGSKQGKSMAKSAEQLKKQIEAMKKFMEGQKNGKKPGNQEGNNFEQLGRMAAEQSAIKKQLMELSQKMNNDGSGKGNGLKEIIKELEDIENQLISNELDLSSIDRQEKISIKLLELEKATKEQEEDKKRESKEAKDNYKKNNLELYNEYLKIKNREIELLKSIPPNLKPYYKNKVNEYFKNMEKEL